MISKSKVMTTAWKKFREFEGKIHFGECLVRAWRDVKYHHAMMEIVNAVKPVKTVSPIRFTRGVNKTFASVTRIGL